MFDALRQRGFGIRSTFHADSILADAFPEVISELEGILAPLRVPVSELVRGGGGEAKVTQKLRRELSAIGWTKLAGRFDRGVGSPCPVVGIGIPLQCLAIDR